MAKKTAKAPKRAKTGRKVGVLPPRHQDTKVRTKLEARSRKPEVRATADKDKPRTGKDLLIVESPTKARTIGKLLGGKMQVLSSKGHIADLPKSRLGVDIEHSFEPEYIKIRGKASVINELKAAARQARAVFIATDPDREGEAIAYSVAVEIGDGRPVTDDRAKGTGAGSPKTGAPVKRVLVYEITAKGLKEALDKPIEIDQRKVDSHRGRRVLDRLVGYLVSPLLWKIVRGGLSAGRVQTVALRMLVDREREIQAFKPEEFWTIKALFEKDRDRGVEGARDRVEKSGGGATFEAQLAKIGGKDFKLTSAAEMEAVKKGCAAASFAVAEVKSRDRARRPLPPFITATMQQDAVQRLSMPARKAMSVAQQLFEGIDLEKETAGLITYPRTDSFRVADAFVRDTREFVAASLGPEFLPEKARHYPDKAGAQGAHEAIRPTRVDRTPDSVKRFLTPEQFRLYELIWRRFVASQMADAVYSLTEVQVTGRGEGRGTGDEGRNSETDEYLFKADAVKCRFSGFERVYGDPDKEKVLPALAPAEPLTMQEFRPEQKFTQPPPRYTEATLIKRLETNSIGRPSTYATIVSTLFDRKYAERREGRLHPTELGMVVTDVLVPRFSDVFELGFTREMEMELDLVEEGKEKWQEVIKRFYTPFKQDLDKVSEGAADIKQDLRKVLDEKCPECGANLAERWGRFGKFIGCSRYPECKYIKKEKAKLLDEKCPQCGKPLVERSGRFGPFKACSGYPECRYIKRDEPGPDMKPGQPCPKCGKPLAEKRGRFGVFVGCTGYPECKFMVRGKRPEPKVLEEKCPQCGKNLVERKGRFGPFIACPGYPKCKYIKKDKGKGEMKKPAQKEEV